MNDVNSYATKHAVLPIGLILVVAEQGAGKTSLVCAKLRKDYKKAGKERRKLALSDLLELKMTGQYPNLYCPKHVYWSKYDFALKGTLSRPKVKTWELTFKELALPNDYFNVQYMVEGGVYVVDECDLELSAYGWQNVNDYQVALWKFIRHIKATIILIAQVDSKVAKQARDLATEVWYVTNQSGPSRIFKRMRWKYDFSKPQLINARKGLAENGVRLSLAKQREMFRRERFVYYGNVFKCYDSFNGKAYFRYKLAENEIATNVSVPCDNTPESIDEFVRRHPLSASVETSKQVMNARNKKLARDLAKNENGKA